MRFKRCLLFATILVLGACATAPNTATVIRTYFDLPAQRPGFNNTLVISVAGDYESRALYERTVAAALVEDGIRATAFFAVMGRRPQLTRTVLDTAILSRRFDTIILTRLKGQDRAGAMTNRPVGQAFELFGYDYAELNDPARIEQAPAITFVTEIYSAADRRKIWAIDSLSFDKETATDLVLEQANTLVDRVRADRIFSP